MRPAILVPKRYLLQSVKDNFLLSFYLFCPLSILFSFYSVSLFTIILCPQYGRKRKIRCFRFLDAFGCAFLGGKLFLYQNSTQGVISLKLQWDSPLFCRFDSYSGASSQPGRLFYEAIGFLETFPLGSCRKYNLPDAVYPWAELDNRLKNIHCHGHDASVCGAAELIIETGEDPLGCLAGNHHLFCRLLPRHHQRTWANPMGMAVYKRGFDDFFGQHLLGCLHCFFKTTFEQNISLEVDLYDHGHRGSLLSPFLPPTSPLRIHSSLSQTLSAQTQTSVSLPQKQKRLAACCGPTSRNKKRRCVDSNICSSRCSERAV